MKRAIPFAAALLSASFALAVPTHAADRFADQSPAKAQSADTNPQEKLTAREYMRQAAMTDLFEIQAGELALSKTKDDGVKSLAQALVTDHRDSSAKLKQAVGNQNSDLPTTLDAKHRDKLAKLKEASGTSFDRQFVAMQVEGHERAVRLHQRYSQNGENPALKSFAGQVLPAIQHHLEMARQLQGQKDKSGS